MNMKEFLIEKLSPAIKELVPEDNWDDIPSFFRRIYLVEYEENVKTYVVGYWDDPNPLLALNIEGYKFVGVVMQDWVEEHGTLVYKEDDSDD